MTAAAMPGMLLTSVEDEGGIACGLDGRCGDGIADC
jgi:hypothetical protein